MNELAKVFPPSSFQLLPSHTPRSSKGSGCWPLMPAMQVRILYGVLIQIHFGGLGRFVAEVSGNGKER